jgi:thiol-disulfide isomerase/thioredoxin
MRMDRRFALLPTLGLAATLSLAALGRLRAGQETQSPAATDGPSDVSGAIASTAADAQAVLAAGVAEAERTDRLVFLHFGAPWCGWCLRLDRWLEREDIAPIFFRDFVNVKIDVEEMPGGQEMLDSYAGGPSGLPWLAILNHDGTVVVNSIAPNGQNIGSPQAEWEIEHWNTMMRTAARRITESEIQYMARTWAEDRPTP